LAPTDATSYNRIGFPKARRLGQAHVARHGAAEHLRTEVLLRIIGHLSAQVEPRVVHRQQHAIEREWRIEVLLHEANGVQQLRDALERVVLALDRDDDAVGRRQHVQRDEPERWGTIEEHVLVLFAHLLQRTPQHRLAMWSRHELELCTDQVLRRRQHVEVGNAEHGSNDLGRIAAPRS
jgi:hypothetical protein